MIERLTKKISTNDAFEARRGKESAKYLAINGVLTLFADGESTLWKGEAFKLWDSMIGANGLLSECTDRAMTEDGDHFDRDLQIRVPIAAPTQQMIDAVDYKFSHSLSRGAKTVKEVLEALGTTVMIVSGGWEQTMTGVQQKLGGIPIYANRLTGGPDGRYEHYDDQRLLAQAASKQLQTDAMIPHLRPPFGVIGDARTDMKINADLKILFTGHSGPRPTEIEQMADVVVDNFALALPLLLGEERWNQAKHCHDPVIRELFEIGAMGILSGQGVKFINQEYGVEIHNRLIRFMDLRIDRQAAPIPSRLNLIYSYT